MRHTFRCLREHCSHQFEEDAVEGRAVLCPACQSRATYAVSPGRRTVFVLGKWMSPVPPMGAEYAERVAIGLMRVLGFDPHLE